MPTKTSSRWKRLDYRVQKGWLPTVLTYSTQNKEMVRSVVSGLNPRWRQYIRNHQNATTSISGTFEVIEAYPGFIFHDFNTWNTTPSIKVREFVAGNFAGYGQSYLSGTYGAESEATNAAYIRFNQKVQKALRDVEGGVVLGELRETLRMLRSPAKGLFNKMGEYLTSVGKRNRGWDKHTSFQKTLADTYLEHSFGWKPFINDIKDAMELYKKIGRKETYVKVSSGAEAIRQVISTRSTLITFGNYIRTIATERAYEKAHVRCKGEVYVRAVTNQEAYLERAGLTFDQFVPTLWELLPWSFLVDYFTNIGDVISYSNRAYSNLAWHCEGLKKELVYERIIQPDVEAMKNLMGAYFTAAGGWPSVARLKRVSVSRGIDTAAVSYSPTLQFNIDLRDTQLLNIAALLGTANGVSYQHWTIRR